MLKKAVAIVLTAIAFAAVCDAREKPQPLFLEVADQSIPAPPADKAQIVLLEPINKIQGLFPVGTFLIDGDRRTLIATTAFHNKAIVLLEPGHHMLMSTQGGPLAHVMEANVEAGKRYYVLLRFLYAHGFQLRPIRSTDGSNYSIRSKDFPEWLSGTKLVERTSEADAFFAKQAEQVEKGFVAAMDTWKGKSSEQHAELTLNPEDAVTLN